MVDDVNSHLTCPLCSSSLVAPTTLPCGHTVCSIHVTQPPSHNIFTRLSQNHEQALLHRHGLPSCPISSCASSSAPSGSRTINNVLYTPAPPDPARLPTRTKYKVANPKIDVKVSKIMELTRIYSAPGVQTVKFKEDLQSELNCEICFHLLSEPITTPCQHTFCKSCLHRSLDHTLKCPLCRYDLPSYAYFQDQPPQNKIILSILTTFFPTAPAPPSSNLTTPLFVLQLSFPGLPTNLHIFEPKYRLMIRRCLASPTPGFGMITSPPPPPPLNPDSDAPQEHSTIEYGTFLKINEVIMLPDGRAWVSTTGSWRFRILERGVVDGYLAGRVERIDDYPSQIDTILEELSIPSLTNPLPTPLQLPSEKEISTLELIIKAQQFLGLIWAHSPTGSEQIKKGIERYGHMPPQNEVGVLSFWIGAVLPITDSEKSKLLPIKSARLRLRLISWWIESLRRTCGVDASLLAAGVGVGAGAGGRRDDLGGCLIS